MLKYKSTCFLIISLFVTSIISAQDARDSLFEMVKVYPDTAKVRILNDFCWNNRNKTPPLALEAGKRALQISETLGDKKLQSKSLNLLGVVYRNLGDYYNSISLYKKALRLAEEMQDSAQIAYAYNNIGGIYRLEGNYKSALEFIFDALSIFEKIGDKKGMSFCTINIGLIYDREKNFDKALEYLNLTLKLRQEILDQSGSALALDLIAHVYFDLGKVDEAMKYFREVEVEYTRLDDKKGLASIWGGMGQVYSLKKKYREAIDYYKRALDMSHNIKFIEGQIVNHNNLGLAYAQLGDFKDADINFGEALKISAGSREILPQLEFYKSFARYKEIRKNYKEAIFYLKKYYSLKDSIGSQKNIRFINELEASYKADKIEKENIILMKDIAAEKKQTNYLIIISLLIIALSVFIYIRYRSNKITNQKLRELNALKDKFFGIIAHDLRNPFSAIFNFSDILIKNFNELKEEEKKDLVDSIDLAGRKAYKLLENLLEWALLQTNGIIYTPTNLKLSQIVKETFYLVQALADKKNISLGEDINEGMIVYGDEEMIKTVLRNLVTNGIKFTENNGRILVSARKNSTHYEISVEDSGCGIDKELQEKLFKIDNVYTSEGTGGERGSGLGLILCKEFVEKNGGKIWVDSEPGKGSKFIFTLPSGK
ncbi:MAG: hypothetical protein CVV24_04515 [Ignavibacteriae bacterium HGW-Ignavibacteriae-3]|nr:MAG: hypothetical protein CVV24_04515 [Ignavibacteriae bacterium HGW-Ignavibacteriae-3]